MNLSQCLLSQISLQAVDSYGICVYVKLIGKEVMLLKHPLQVSSTKHTYWPDIVAMTPWVHCIHWILWPLMPRPLHHPCNWIHIWHVVFRMGPLWARNTRHSLNGCPEELIRTVGVFGPLNQFMYPVVFQHTTDVTSVSHKVGISWQNGQVEGRRVLVLSCPLRQLRYKLIWWSESFCNNKILELNIVI